MIKILHLFYIPACWHIVFLITASNKYSIIEGKTLYCRLKSKPYQRKIIPHYLTHL
ncbi:hypothetical protein Avbf_18312 [Armadillidium vulgare]|nr:hypothetical protein Avbf_10394 [Armadillidium vulgare]RXG64131.1 hypothetical protein Avbf_18312 [Armadillidium vulgare]